MCLVLNDIIKLFSLPLNLAKVSLLHVRIFRQEGEAPSVAQRLLL